MSPIFGRAARREVRLSDSTGRRDGARRSHVPQADIGSVRSSSACRRLRSVRSHNRYAQNRIDDRSVELYFQTDLRVKADVRVRTSSVYTTLLVTVLRIPWLGFPK
jgi:hypothetical protein